MLRSIFFVASSVYDPMALARAVCASRSWTLTEARFYTGVPDAGDNPFWSHFWTAKLAQMGP